MQTVSYGFDNIPVTLQLNDEEQQFIQAHPVIRVSNEMDWPPFDYIENGKPSGFAMDYFALISEIIGLQFKIVNGFSWPQLLEMGRKKEIDLFPAIWNSPEREQFLKFTLPVIPSFFQATCGFCRSAALPGQRRGKKLL